MLNFSPQYRHPGKLEDASGSFFGDKRILSRYKKLFAQMCSSPGVILRQLSHTHSEEAAYYRLLGNSRFSYEEILRINCLETLENAQDLHILAIGDSSEIELETRADYYEDPELCGYLSSNKRRGLIAHPTIALDADRLWVLGLCDLLVWGRPKARKKKTRTQRAKLHPEERESYKWSLGIKGSSEVLSKAQKVTYVFDREADILKLFQEIEAQGADFVIRAKHNRVLQDGKTTIEQALSQVNEKATHTLMIRGENSRKSSKGYLVKAREQRKAKLEITYTQVQLQQSKKPYYVVDILECSESVPEAEKPIHWRLITSHPVHKKAQALKILNFYASRWIIEELFRIIKSKGFQLESVQLRHVTSIRKMIALSIAAGLSILQLNLAKSHQIQMPIKWIFTQKEIHILKMLSNKLSGKTEKLKNPYSENELLYAHWVLARLGGWKGYQKKRPPGPITLLKGKKRFKEIFNTLQVFNDQDVWVP